MTEPLPPTVCSARSGATGRPHAGLVHAPGRSLLPEYRALRGDGDILETCRHPEEVVELTLQPLRRMPVDAAILFTDIMVPLQAVGLPVRIEAGRGPVVDDPIRDARPRRALRPLEPEATSRT